MEAINRFNYIFSYWSISISNNYVYLVSKFFNDIISRKLLKKNQIRISIQSFIFEKVLKAELYK
jgi:hypothetical protein